MALISKVESIVSLPQGAGRLQCYARHYALLQGKEIADWWGIEETKMAGRKLLVGRYMVMDGYLRNEKPGVFWSSSIKDLPEIMDAGCSQLNVYHMVGEDEAHIRAFCSANIDGHSPEKVEPPVTC